MASVVLYINIYLLEPNVEGRWGPTDKMGSEGRQAVMRGWRGKIIFLLVVYFAGFATAIYCLAPVPENRTGEKGFAHSAFKSDEFAKSFNAGLHKCVDFGKGAACHAGKFMKQKLDERRADS